MKKNRNHLAALALAFCFLILGITASEAATVVVSGTYTPAFGTINSGSFDGSLTVTSGVFTGGDVFSTRNTGLLFGEFNILDFGSSTEIDLSDGSWFIRLNFSGGSISGQINSEVSDTAVAFLTGTVGTPLPATLPLLATGIGGLGLLGWRRTRKARAVA